jgi:hypothetical protein
MNLEKGRKGKWRRNRCVCCRPGTSNPKEPRYLLKALAYGKRVNYAPFHSTWCIKDELVDHCDRDYVPGLSRWKKTMKREI